MTPDDLQQSLMHFIRSFGLHQPEQTPCGQALTVSEAHALSTLATTSQLSQQDLAEQLGLEKSSVSRLLTKLEQRGWVKRHDSQHDGRSKVLQLSETGKGMVSQLQAARRKKFDAIFTQIPASERDAVEASLKTLIQACDQAAKEP